MEIKVTTFNKSLTHQYVSIICLISGQELGTLVLQVTANDKDLNPVLRYDFARNGNPGSAFSIDRYSGRITVVKELDYEKKSRYLLQVKVCHR